MGLNRGRQGCEEVVARTVVGFRTIIPEEAANAVSKEKYCESGSVRTASSEMGRHACISLTFTTWPVLNSRFRGLGTHYYGRDERLKKKSIRTK